MSTLTDDELDAAIAQAGNGDRDALDELCKQALWRADGEADGDALNRVAQRLGAARADDAIATLAALSRVKCPEGTPEEILPMVGLLAHGHRVAADVSRLEPLVAALEKVAQDRRARVRAIAPLALACAGATHGARLLERFSRYLKTGDLDSFVLEALARDEWLSRFDDAQPLIDKLDQCLRACAKSPSWESVAVNVRLSEALRHVPAAIAARFPDAVKALFDRWATICKSGPLALSQDGGKDIKPFWEKGLERVAAIIGAGSHERRVTRD
jgi:hypothetical protein